MPNINLHINRKPLKIGFIYYRYPLYLKGSYFQNFLNRCAKSISQIYLIATCYPSDNFIKPKNLKIFWIPSLNAEVIGDIFFMFTALLKTIFTKEMHEVDVIDIIGPRGILAAWYLRKRYKIPIICRIEMLNEEKFLLDYLRYHFTRFFLLRIGLDRIICWSNYYTERHLIKWGIPKDKIVVISPGIDSGIYSPAVDGTQIKKKYAPDCPLIVFAKPLYSTNTEAAIILVKSIAILKPKMEIRLLLGNGYGKNQVEKLAQKLSIQDKVRFMPLTPFNDITKYIAAADLIVLPFTYSPTVSRSLLEAMAVGKAVITNPMGEVEILFHHKKEVYFSRSNPQDIAKAISTLLKNPQLVNEIGKRAREVMLRKFDPENYNRKIINIIKELAEKKSGVINTLSVEKKETHKTVSVIIPTFNRAKEVVGCIDSVLQSSYKNIEILVVDNASSDNTVELIKTKFSNNQKIKLIQSRVNRSAAGGRNLGAKYAYGDYLLFIDSDNVIDKKMISNLVNFFENRDDCGMVGPLMLYKTNPDIIWLYFADINMYTSHAKYRGTGENNNKQYQEIINVGHLPNCFMVRKVDFEKIGEFNEKYAIMYEEADLAQRIKKILRKNIFCYTKAITYHNVSLPNKNTTEDFGFQTVERVYLTARNRVYFMKKNASLLQFLSFLFIFDFLILLYYEFMLLKRHEFKKARAYFRGNIDGFLILSRK